MERVLGASDHLLTYGKGCLSQTLDDRSLVVLSLLEGDMTLVRLELCPCWNTSLAGTLPQLDFFVLQNPSTRVLYVRILGAYCLLIIWMKSWTQPQFCHSCESL